MNTSVKRRDDCSYPAITGVGFSQDYIWVELSDGRYVRAPLAWFPALLNATSAQLENYEISPAGYGIHWPELDEDVSVRAFLD